ncbi:MAG: hypothetical protein AAF928_14850 [Myxococcota bacterium]
MPRAKSWSWSLTLALGGVALGCGGARGGPTSPGGGPDGDTGPARGTRGTLDAAAVARETTAASTAAEACVAEAREIVPAAGGAMTVRLVVNGAGEVTESYLADNDFGFDVTERCVLDAFRARRWPSPRGGDLGEVTHTLTFPPAAELAAAATWGAEDLRAAMTAEAAEGEDPFAALSEALAGCRAAGAAGAMTATLYLDEDGLVQAVGTSASDVAGGTAGACVVEKIQATTFPAPEGTTKVTLPVP